MNITFPHLQQQLLLVLRHSLCIASMGLIGDRQERRTFCLNEKKARFAKKILTFFTFSPLSTKISLFPPPLRESLGNGRESVRACVRGGCVRTAPGKLESPFPSPLLFPSPAYRFSPLPTNYYIAMTTYLSASLPFLLFSFPASVNSPTVPTCSSSKPCAPSRAIANWSATCTYRFIILPRTIGE